MPIAPVDTGSPYLHLSAATSAVSDRFVASTAMKVGAYTVATPAMPTAGGRFVTVTVTASDTADTMGTITIGGTDLAGDPQTELLAPVAGSTVTGTKAFLTVTTVTGAGWVIDGAEGTADTIVVGCAAGAVVATTPGNLDRIVVNKTAAATITVKDGASEIAVLKASIAEDDYTYGIDYTGPLTVDLAGASDVTVVYHPLS